MMLKQILNTLNNLGLSKLNNSIFNKITDAKAGINVALKIINVAKMKVIATAIRTVNTDCHVESITAARRVDLHGMHLMTVVMLDRVKDSLFFSLNNYLHMLLGLSVKV